MADHEELNISSIVGSSLCVAASDGQKVFAEIEDAIRSGKCVCLSFQGVDDLTSAFLNSAVGQLYGKYSEQEIKAKLSIKEDSAAPEDLRLLKRVTDRAKDFFKNPDRFKVAAKKALGDDYGN
jgi:hypothetical protein